MKQIYAEERKVGVADQAQSETFVIEPILSMRPTWWVLPLAIGLSRKLRHVSNISHVVSRIMLTIRRMANRWFCRGGRSPYLPLIGGRGVEEP